MKRFMARKHKDYKRDNETTIWMDWAEKRVLEAINDCIKMVETMHDSYDKYYERVALKNVVKTLELYELGREIKEGDL